jgi:hypothetical protein
MIVLILVSLLPALSSLTSMCLHIYIKPTSTSPIHVNEAKRFERNFETSNKPKDLKISNVSLRYTNSYGGLGT